MKSLALLTALVAFSTSAFAEGSYQDVNELKAVKAVVVVFTNQVTDGCLGNSAVLKLGAELILRKSGISVVPVESAAHELKIQARGFRYEQQCTAVVTVDLFRFVHLPEGYFGRVTSYDNVDLLAYPESEMQERLYNSVSEIISDLANEILKAQGK